MDETVTQAREQCIEALTRIAHFWGFPKAMGAAYGVVYLSPEPVSLTKLAELVGVSKGAMSTHARALERLGLVRKHIRAGERRDYYSPETDFWKIVKDILREREKPEFDRALKAVGHSLELIKKAPRKTQKTPEAAFHKDRLDNLRQFFQTLDKFVSLFLTLDELRLGALRSLLGRRKPKA